MINQVQKSNDIYETFVNSFGEDLFNKVTEAMGGAVVAWKDAQKDLSVNNLKYRITCAAENAAKEFGHKAPDYINAAIEANTQEISKKVNSIISLYASQGKKVDIPSPRVGSINIPGVNLNDVMKELAEKLEAESNVWGAVIGGAAIGVAIAILGPIAWIGAGAAYLAKKLFGTEETEEEKREKALAKPLDASKRLEVYNSLDADWQKICGSVADTIEASLRENQQIKRSIALVVKELMEAYKKSLRDARVLTNIYYDK